VVSVVKDALCSAEAHVHEVLSLYSYLRVACNRSTSWIELIDFRGIVIEEPNLSRILLVLVASIVDSE
jgi:hypothetical protein